MHGRTDMMLKIRLNGEVNKVYIMIAIENQSNILTERRFREWR